MSRKSWWRGPWLPALVAVAFYLLVQNAPQGSVLVSTAATAFADAPGSSPSVSQAVPDTTLAPLVAAADSAVGPVPAGPPGGWEIVIDPRDFGFIPAPAAAPRDPRETRALIGGSRGIAILQAPPSPTSEESADRYRIREGDLLDVYVWGQENLSSKFRVARDGTITPRLVGTVEVRGLTANEAGARMAEKLRAYLVQPAVTVSVAEESGRDLLLFGEVEVPGVYPLDRPMTLLELLIRAKYKSATSDLSTVTVIRDRRPTVVNLSAVLRGERVEENMDLQSGDVVVVPGRETVIGIHGAALKPGRYRFDRERRITVRDVLMEGSMWTTRANLEKAFVLRADGSIHPVDINALWFRAAAAQDLALHNGDALVIPEVPEVGVYILGKVHKPGLHQITGTANMLQALALASPDPMGARLYDARLVRGWPHRPRVYAINLRSLMEGDLTQNITVQHGDVIYIPETAVSYSLEFWNRLLQPLGGTASVVRSVEEIGED